jgi:hypothetical protein
MLSDRLGSIARRAGNRWGKSVLDHLWAAREPGRRETLAVVGVTASDLRQSREVLTKVIEAVWT